MASSNPEIDAFMESYQRERKSYRRLAKLAKKICEKNLQDPPIPAIVTCRAKTEESLRKKLEQRNARVPLTSERDIREWITDLVGVRVAVYIPSQSDEVGKMVNRSFVVKDWRDRFSGSSNQVEEGVRRYERRFGGYEAKHYQVEIKADDISANYIKCIVEIQVISLLAHAWAELEHGIEYKQIISEPSPGEKRTLDCLNGLVQTGEVLTDLLHEQFITRITEADRPFANKHELGTFLYRRLSHTSLLEETSDTKDSVSVLFKFLQALNMDTPRALIPKIDDLGFGATSNLQVDRIAEKYHPFKLKLAMYIMEHALSALSSEHEMQAVDKAKKDVDVDTYKCRVLISSLVWLLELFPRFIEVTLKLEGSVREMTREQKSSLKWALQSGSRRTVLDNEGSSELDHEHLNILWNWFEHHSEAIVQFVFAISRLGVWEYSPLALRQLHTISEHLHSALRY